ncbi:MAG TPA: cyclic nucleotide-binding domain-containing protein [Pseudolabrys sp.]|nr:cyclic nucleotide-binding domain-containing protein [Pseudolabrys sp.]
MGLEDDIAFFERVPTLAVLGKQALRVLAIGAESRHLQGGAVLFYAGEMADGGYIVQEGSMVVEPEGSTGQEYTIGPGTLLGELALLTDTTSPVTAIAKEPTTLIRIPRSLFRKMLEGYPAAAMRLRDELAGRVGDWTQDIEKVRNKLEGRGK